MEYGQFQLPATAPTRAPNPRCPLLKQPPRQRLMDGLRICEGVLWMIAKQDAAKLRLIDQFQPRMRADLCGGRLCQLDGSLDHRRQPILPPGLKRQPDFEGVETPPRE